VPHSRASCAQETPTRARLIASLCTPPQDLIAVKGLSDAKVEKIMDAAGKARAHLRRLRRRSAMRDAAER
jgi:hypothetical protein